MKRDYIIKTIEITLELLREAPAHNDPLARTSIELMSLVRIRDMFNRNIALLEMKMETMAREMIN